MPPKKPAPAKAAPARAAAKPAGRGGPAARGAPAGRGGPAGRGAPAGKGAPAKKGAAPAAVKKAEPEKPKEKVWTKQDDSARKIQTKYRQYRAKKMLEKKKKEKEDYNELMEKIEKEAFVKLVKMEQERAEKLRLKEEEERRRKKEERIRKKKMLEAAFDGDVDEMAAILKEVVDLDNKNGVGDDVIGRSLRNKHVMAVVECEDANENTPLSEAGSGGNIDAIKFLLDRGADPNTIGQFMRTPLYRAAFAGHLEACEVLLQNGADPRLYASDSQTPDQIASSPAIRELIESWDMEQTEILLKKLEADKEKRKEQDRQRREAETSKMENVVAEAQKAYDIMQKRLTHSYNELNKRINEHDTAVGEGFARPDLTIQAIKDQEAEVEILKIDMDKCRDELANAKLKLREQQMGGDEIDPDDLPGLKVNIKELDDVLMRDVGNRIQESGKWPMLIDPNGQAAMFLRYRDTNYINTLSPPQMEPDKIRLALLGCIRYGKPLVVDMMEVDMFNMVESRLSELREGLMVIETPSSGYGKPLVVDMMEVDMFHVVESRFSEVLEGLMDMVIDKSIMKEENYVKLIRPTDPPDYHQNKFNDARTCNFKLYLITKNPFPPEDLIEKFYLIRIHIPVLD